MPDVIFARPRHNYDSYRDLYQLITLSGYPLIYFDEIDPASDNCYIMTIANGENQTGWQQPKARIILWDLEWRNDAEQIPGVAETWASDPWYAARIGARFVLLGSHPDLNPCPADRDGNFEYDVAMMAYMIPRREQVKTWLRASALNIAPNGWGDERHNILSHSRAMVHVHQWDEFPCIAPQRFAFSAAYQLPVISEDVWCKIPELRGVEYQRWSKLADYIAGRVHLADLQNSGIALYESLCVEHTFKKCVEAAL